jgi:translation initiation factor 1 (eIF-1/SUI1)
MGTYNTVYIGVYVEIPHIKSTVTINYLANPHNGKAVKYKFHPETGEKSIPSTREEGCWLEPKVYEIEGLREDEFFAPAYAGPAKTTTFITQTRKYGKTLSDLTNIDLSEADPQAKIKEFKDEFLTIIQAANKDFEINVKYGVVYYAH